jgi:hypothetical protein
MLGGQEIRHMHFLMMMLLMFWPGNPAKDATDYTTARLERRLKAVKSPERIAVDGKLDEAAWADAPIASDFIQTEPKEGDTSAERTEVRVLYDNQHLYLGVYAHDSAVAHLVISDLKKDFSTDSGDTFEVVLDTFHDQRNGYIFSTNPAGAKADSQMINEGREVNSNWDGVWYVKTQIADDGWVAEMAIPFKTFKFRDSDVQTWGINFHRSLRSQLRNEDSYWAPLLRIYNLQRVSLAGTLEGLEGITSGANIRLKPYVSSSLAQNGATGVRKGDGDFGFDVKYGITSGLTWDFTYNTDFSQVEADEQQINLTRFNLFFPEKREFFLENSGIFKFGGGEIFAQAATASSVANDVLFFSRNIGLSPTIGAVPILGGTRLTGRVGSYEVGFLNMQQRAYKDSAATNFTVGRLKHNILANSDVGVMILDKEIQDSPRFNRVFGADANFRFGQFTTVNAFVTKSTAPGVSSDNMEGRLAFGYQDRSWIVKAAYNNIQANFVNEMGYVPRRGFRRFDTDLRRNFRPNSKLIRQITPHTVIDYFADSNGHFDSKYMDQHLGINFQNGAFFEIGKNPAVEVLKKSFSVNNGKNIVPAGTYNNYDFFAFYRPDVSRRLQPNARWSLGPFYTGYKHAYTFGETFRLNHKFNASLNYTHNNISLADGHFKTNLMTARINYSASTSVFLNALVQYNSDQRQWSSNVRFNVIHRPLSDFYFVYNERRNSLTGDLLDRAVIAKVTYMIQK